MISRTFTVDRDGDPLMCYKGFNQMMVSDDGKEAEYMAVVIHDGELELYFLDDVDGAYREWRRFVHHEQEIWNHYKVKGVYRIEQVR